MKQKLFKILPIAAVAIFITACGQQENNQTGQPISDFFTFEPNTTFLIHNLDEELEHLNQEIFTSHISADGSRIQQRISVFNIEATVVLENSNGSLRQIFAWSETPVWHDITGINEFMEIVILQEPLILGHSWNNGVGGISEITATNLEITTPVGIFEDVIEVTTTFPGLDDYVISLFAPGHGTISETYRSTLVYQGQEIISIGETQLSSVRTGGLPVTIDVFYMDDNLMSLEHIPVNVEIQTNQDFVSLFSDIIANHMPSISHTTINNIYVDMLNSLVTVDFASDFFPINLGAGAEGLMLSSLANTFGMFYGLENFLITIDGANYESGHILFEEGETIQIGATQW